MGQTLLVLCAMMLLSLVVLQANGIILTKYSDTYDMQTSLEAISVAQAKLDNVSEKAFDEKSIAKKIYVATDLTAASSLGPETGESGPAQYDDIDDFNGATETLITPTVDSFTITYRVEYVTVANPDVVSAWRTFFKRVKVTISNPSMNRPVIATRIIVYRRYQ